ISRTRAVFRPLGDPMDCLRKKGGESSPYRVLVHEPDRRAHHARLCDLSKRSSLHRRTEHRVSRLYSQPDADCTREPGEPAGQPLSSTNITLCNHTFSTYAVSTRSEHFYDQ